MGGSFSSESNPNSVKQADDFQKHVVIFGTSQAGKTTLIKTLQGENSDGNEDGKSKSTKPVRTAIQFGDKIFNFHDTFGWDDSRKLVQSDKEGKNLKGIARFEYLLPYLLMRDKIFLIDQQKQVPSFNIYSIILVCSLSGDTINLDEKWRVITETFKNIPHEILTQRTIVLFTKLDKSNDSKNESAISEAKKLKLDYLLWQNNINSNQSKFLQPNNGEIQSSQLLKKLEELNNKNENAIQIQPQYDQKELQSKINSLKNSDEMKYAHKKILEFLKSDTLFVQTQQLLKLSIEEKELKEFAWGFFKDALAYLFFDLIKQCKEMKSNFIECAKTCKNNILDILNFFQIGNDQKWSDQKPLRNLETWIPKIQEYQTKIEKFRAKYPQLNKAKKSDESDESYTFVTYICKLIPIYQQYQWALTLLITLIFPDISHLVYLIIYGVKAIYLLVKTVQFRSNKSKCTKNDFEYCRNAEQTAKWLLVVDEILKYEKMRDQIDAQSNETTVA